MHAQLPVTVVAFVPLAGTGGATENTLIANLQCNSGLPPAVSTIGSAQCFSGAQGGMPSPGWRNDAPWPLKFCFPRSAFR